MTEESQVEESVTELPPPLSIGWFQVHDFVINKE